MKNLLKKCDKLEYFHLGRIRKDWYTQGQLPKKSGLPTFYAKTPEEAIRRLLNCLTYEQHNKKSNKERD